MKVHLLERRSSGNMFIDHLANGLSELTEVTVSSNLKDLRETTNILHIHWPETLNDWQVPSKLRVKEIEQTLVQIKANGTQLVWTRHNACPHSGNQKTKLLYDLVRRYADAVIHLGPMDLDELKKDRPHALHLVIPHGMYTEVKPIKQEEARAQLGLSHQDIVVVIPGRIRTMAERQLIRSLISNGDDQRIQYLIPRWNEPIGFSWIHQPFKRKQEAGLIKEVSQLPNCKMEVGFVDQAMMDQLFSACDWVVVPRLATLNSGLLYMGLSYGKAIYGPDSGNVGHYLKETGNYCFSTESFTDVALPDVERAELKKLGNANQSWVKENGNWVQIAEKHLNLYNKCLL